jgi:hypothetical protein
VIPVRSPFKDAQAEIDLRVGFVLHAVSQSMRGRVFWQGYTKLRRNHSVLRRFL